MNITQILTIQKAPNFKACSTEEKEIKLTINENLGDYFSYNHIEFVLNFTFHKLHRFIQINCDIIYVFILILIIPKRIRCSKSIIGSICSRVMLSHKIHLEFFRRLKRTCEFHIISFFLLREINLARPQFKQNTFKYSVSF